MFKRAYLNELVQASHLYSAFPFNKGSQGKTWPFFAFNCKVKI